MQNNSMVDNWLHDKDRSRENWIPLFFNTLDMEQEIISSLVKEDKYWEAFNRLNSLFLYYSDHLEHEGTRGHRPIMIPALIEWIAKNKNLIDDIVQGIGGDGYGISSSTLGVSISVSFGSGGVVAQAPGRTTSKASSSGTRRAIRPQARTPSPSAMRSTVKNPNNPAFRAAAGNRSNQMNPNSRAYRSSRGGGRRR